MDDFTPIQVMSSDVEDKNLLLRLIRKIADRLTALGNRISGIEKAPPPPSFAQIRDQLQAQGSASLNVANLYGVLAQPQPAGVYLSAGVPTGQVLQSLHDGQLVFDTTGSTLYYVAGGNPNTLVSVASGGGSFMTTNTNQSPITGQKTYTVDQTFSNILLTGTATQYKNISTVNNGIPAEYAAITRVAQAGSIGSSLVYAVPGAAGTATRYRANVSIFCSAAGAAGTVLCTIAWTDPNVNAASQATGTADLTILGSQANLSVIITSDSGVNINYSTTQAGGAGARYDLYISLEAL